MEKDAQTIRNYEMQSLIQKKPEEKLITDLNHIYGTHRPLTDAHMHDDSDFKISRSLA